MADLIIHIGPGKCASTSIQDFFIQSDNKNEFIFVLLDEEKQIWGLNKTETNLEKLSNMESLICTHSKQTQTLILSHECLSTMPLAVMNICKVAKAYVNNIKIIGYCRKQSGYVISAYSQWYFRSKERIQEVNERLLRHLINLDVFTGLEKFLIAGVFTNFETVRTLENVMVYDWLSTYLKIIEKTRGFNTELLCDSLHSFKPNQTSLLQDFCNKAGIESLNDNDLKRAYISNISFNSDLVESIGLAHGLGLEAPGPHDKNFFLERTTELLSNEQFSINSGFLEVIKNYIDSFFYDSNRQLCEILKMDPSLFRPKKAISKQEVIEHIKKEEKRRLENPIAVINTYKKICSQITLSLIKAIEENHFLKERS